MSKSSSVGRHRECPGLDLSTSSAQELRALEAQENNADVAELLTSAFVLLGNVDKNTRARGPPHLGVHEGSGRGAALAGGWRGTSL